MCKRACQFGRMKSRVTKALGKFMFEEMTDEEMIASIPKTMPVVTGIHNEEQLAKFMAKEQSHRLPLDYLQWRVFFVPDYRPDESLFVYKVHHSLADGIAIILFFTHLTDNPKISQYPQLMKRFGFVKSTIIYLMIPVYLLWLTVKMVILMKHENNAFHNKEITRKLTAEKNVEFIPDLKLDTIKEKAKELSTAE